MVKKYKFVIFDIETDGLLSNKFHCFCYAYIDHDGKWVYGTILDPKKIPAFLQQFKLIVGHNIIRFDNPVIKKFTGFEIDYNNCIDTLAMSWWLYPNRPKHGLEYIGTLHGVEKPEIEDWENLEIEQYVHRCAEDVKINRLEFLAQMAKIASIYGSDKETILRAFQYASFKMHCLKLQEDRPFKLDITMTERVLNRMELRLSEKRESLVSVMPKVAKKAKKIKPAKTHKNNGDLSVQGIKWFKLLADEGLPEDYEGEVEYVKSWAEPNPNSTGQLKEWLFSYGWKPKTYKYVKEDDGSTRAIPQINDGGKLCDSVKLLAEEHEVVRELEGYSVLKARSGMLKGFLRDCDEEGFIKASASGFTNTMRLKHKTLVNLPGVTGKNDAADGIWIRGCLKTVEGKELCGADISSLEDCTKQHYMWDYDPEYVKEMNSADYDPHVAIGLLAEIISEEEAAWFKSNKSNEELDEKEKKNLKSISNRRKKAKVVNFCLPVDKTKVLTEQGWKSYDELYVGDLIYSLNKDTKNLELTPITELPFFENSEVGVIGNKDWGFECTENHRWFVKRRNSKRDGFVHKFYETKDLRTECNIITSAEYRNDGCKSISTQDVRFLSWILSDGYLAWSKKGSHTSDSNGVKKHVRCSISQKKYWQVLEKDLENIPYKKYKRADGVHIYDININFIRNFWRRLFNSDTNKHDTDYTEVISNMSYQQRQEFIDVFILADGGIRRGQKLIYQNRGNILDGVLLALTLNGHSYSTFSNGIYKNKENITVSIKNRQHVTCQKFSRWVHGRNTDVFCANNKNGTFIAKQGDTVTITGNSGIYGVGAKKLSLTIGCTEKEAKKLLEAYWTKNWSVKELAKNQLVIEVDGEMWLKNPVSGFYYSLRYEKDIFSTLNQGTGVYVFDTWLKHILAARPQLTAQFHDEIVLNILKDRRKQCDKLLKQAMDKTNEELQLNVEIKFEADYGPSYAAVH